MICVTDWAENIVGKGENAGYQHFLLFPQCFQKASFPESSKVGIYSVVKSYDSFHPFYKNCKNCSLFIYLRSK